MNVFQKIIGRSPGAQTLVARVHLSTYYDSEAGGLLYEYEHGTISDLGFAEHGGFEITHPAPKAEPVVNGRFYLDKMFVVRSGETQSALGHAEIKEDFVYDSHYRSQIDYTGLRLDVTLRRSAFDDYREFIGTVRQSSDTDPTTWRGELLISIPARKFEFPKGRGSAPPYPPPGAEVRNLRSIKSFNFDRLDIIKSRPADALVTAASENGSTKSENTLSLR